MYIHTPKSFFSFLFLFDFYHPYFYVLQFCLNNTKFVQKKRVYKHINYEIIQIVWRDRDSFFLRKINLITLLWACTKKMSEFKKMCAMINLRKYFFDIQLLAYKNNINKDVGESLLKAHIS